MIEEPLWGNGFQPVIPTPEIFPAHIRKQQSHEGKLCAVGVIPYCTLKIPSKSFVPASGIPEQSRAHPGNSSVLVLHFSGGKIAYYNFFLDHNRAVNSATRLLQDRGPQTGLSEVPSDCLADGSKLWIAPESITAIICRPHERFSGIQTIKLVPDLDKSISVLRNYGEYLSFTDPSKRQAFLNWFQETSGKSRLARTIPGADGPFILFDPAAVDLFFVTGKDPENGTGFRSFAFRISVGGACVSGDFHSGHPMHMSFFPVHIIGPGFRKLSEIFNRENAALWVDTARVKGRSHYDDAGKKFSVINVTVTGAEGRGERIIPLTVENPEMARVLWDHLGPNMQRSAIFRLPQQDGRQQGGAPCISTVIPVNFRKRERQRKGPA